MNDVSDFIKKRLRVIEKNSSFKEWNEGNKLSSGEPLLLFHGTYHNPFEEIDLDKGSNSNHFSNGLHLSSNIKEVVNNYVAEIKEGSFKLDVVSKLNNHLDIILNALEYEEVTNLIKSQYNLTDNAIKLLEDDLINTDKFLENFILLAYERLDDEEFYENFRVPKSYIDINGESIFSGEFTEFDFLKNIYCQNDGLILPFFVRSEKPLYYITKEVSEINDMPVSEMLVYDHYRDMGDDIDDFINTMNSFLRDVEKKAGGKLDSNIVKNIFLESVTGLVPNDEYESFSFSDFVMNSYDSWEIINGDDLKDRFFALLEEVGEDYNEEIIEFIPSIEDEFYNNFSEDDDYVVCFDEGLKEELVEKHKTYCDMVDKSTELLSGSVYFAFQDFWGENVECCSMFELVSIRDVVEKMNVEDFELKEEFCNKVIPSIYDVAVFHGNTEFTYIDESGYGEAFHYLVFDKNKAKYAFNNTFSRDNNRLSARRVEDSIKPSLMDDEIDLALSKIKKIYPYYPKVIKKDYKKDTIAEFDHCDENIIIYRDNIKSESQLMKTLLHEYVVHYGLHKTLGESGEELLLDAYKYFDKKGHLDELKKIYPEFDDKTRDGKCRLAEEKLAFMSENQLIKKNGFLDKLIYKIKKSFHEIKCKLGIGHMEDKIFMTIDTVDESLKIQNDFKFHRNKSALNKKIVSCRKKRLGV